METRPLAAHVRKRNYTRVKLKSFKGRRSQKTRRALV